MEQPYREQFYQNQRQGSRQSANEIIPLVLALIQPKSVIDVGCGVGAWLSVFKAYGVEEILGIDGDYVERNNLEIPEEQFLAHDLSQPIHMNRQFDLVVSLEVAEHLTRECAEIFINSLTSLGSVMLFSAAIPFQGGTHHVNEQWPDYWVNLFQKKQYTVIDPLRKRIWENDDVEWWYAQNILMFVKQDHLEHHVLLKREYENTNATQLSLVHPRKYLETIQLHLTIQDIAMYIPLEAPFILVDQEQLGIRTLTGRRVIPFLEHDGYYMGLPSDSHTAISELERLHQSGANFLAFAWPAFWWLDYYTEFYHYLDSKYSCILQNDHLVIFDLQQ